jgi:heme/copper-type cytochrome/quinol oxidase subunit 2
MNFMNEKTTTPGLLRLAAAVFLGLIVGFILFFVATLFIGTLNQLMGMQIPVGMDIAENVISAILLVVFVVGSIALFCWKVWTTPATEEEEESPVPED